MDDEDDNNEEDILVNDGAIAAAAADAAVMMALVVETNEWIVESAGVKAHMVQEANVAAGAEPKAYYIRRRQRDT